MPELVVLGILQKRVSIREPGWIGNSNALLVRPGRWTGVRDFRLRRTLKVNAISQEVLVLNPVLSIEPEGLSVILLS
jgi:hypothetical protein